MRLHARRRAILAAGLAAVVMPVCGVTTIREAANASRQQHMSAVEIDTADPELTLAWNDEFDDGAGAPPDPSKWVYDTGGEPQWGNQEWEYYTSRPENVSQNGDGSLAIVARRETLPGMSPCPYGTCDITSGRITTRGKFSQTYGRWEARIKVPEGQGMWPAFWMMGDTDEGWPDCGEIDIMEIVNKNPGTVEGTLWGPDFPENGFGSDYTLPNHARFSSDYHVFAIDWTPDKIAWSVDGEVYFSHDRSQMSAHQWVFDNPFYGLLNLAVGGEMPGAPDATTKFPATMLVDYVHVYAPAP